MLICKKLIFCFLLEKLSIVIPWKNLRSNPTKVHLDGLYMLIVPKNGRFLKTILSISKKYL